MLNVESNKIDLSENTTIHKDDITWDFKRASKPGGSASNSQAVGAELRLPLDALGPNKKDILENLTNEAKNKINDNNEIIIYSEEHRSQHENREECIEKLRNYIKEAEDIDKVRKQTKPPREVKEELLDEKKQHGRKKEMRQPIQTEKYQDS